MTEKSTHLYRAEQVREMDCLAIEERKIPGIELMERAGLAAYECLIREWPEARKILVFCGSGNNGGDGYVIARLAIEAGMQVQIYTLCEMDRLKGDALTAAKHITGTDISCARWQADLPVEADVIVDAMLGTGLNGEVSGHYREAIEAINATNIPALAIDIPSGLHADTGTVLGVAVRAKHTISFIGMKQGLLTGDARDYVGQLHFSGLAIPHDIYDNFELSARSVSYRQLKTILTPRNRNLHKGQAGHVLIIGGNKGLLGAVHMAGEAALRCGAGLVSIATRGEHASTLNTDRPELMVHGIGRAADLKVLLQKADVIAIGPGLGQDDWASVLFATAMESSVPKVVDADALNLLAENPFRSDNWTLTPHPGEAARLLGVSTADIHMDRYNAVMKLQQQYGGTVVLKGAGSLIQSAPRHLVVCTDGNPGMATGGMGDVLTGIIASLRAQGLSQQDAAELGVCIHGASADMAAEDGGERGLLATDLMPVIRQLVNPQLVNC